jgi:hypothetical protein
MKRRFIAGVLVIALGLSGCGAPETTEVIATTAAATAATFEMSTAAKTTATETTTKTNTTTTTPTTTAPPETTTELTTTELPREIYEIETPPLIEVNQYSQPPNVKISEDLYDVEISEKALELYDKERAFEKIKLATIDSEYGYQDGYYLNAYGYHEIFGLIDLDNDGEPEHFSFVTRMYQGFVDVIFYDGGESDPLKELAVFPGFCRDGVTYFGKNEDGNMTICSGYYHGYTEQTLYIGEMLYDKNADTEKLTEGETFAAAFSDDGGLHCSAYSLNGVRYGYNEPVPAAEFEKVHSDIYDTLDFDVYWICGDILYHGAEETEYKGKMAYEKYLEFTKKQEYFDIALSDANNILIDDFNKDGISDAVLVSNTYTDFAYYHNGEIRGISANAYYGGLCKCGKGAPLYYNKKTNEFLALNTASRYMNYNFYGFSDGEYMLKNEYIWREIIDVWDIDKWKEMPNLESYLETADLTFEDLQKLNEGELLGQAWVIGTFDRVNQYTIDDKEVTEAEWQKAIDDFIAADDTVLLCPKNTDLEFSELD